MSQPQTIAPAVSNRRAAGELVAAAGEPGHGSPERRCIPSAINIHQRQPNAKHSEEQVKTQRRPHLPPTSRHMTHRTKHNRTNSAHRHPPKQNAAQESTPPHYDAP
jgi:hypothetical protein